VVVVVVVAAAALLLAVEAVLSGTDEKTFVWELNSPSSLYVLGAEVQVNCLENGAATFRQSC
jgi:hypothetical protein